MDEKMYIDGLQHIGIPVDDIDISGTFYESLGFKEVYRVYYEPDRQWIRFMELNDLVLELYQESSVKRDGAINHLALNCLDIDKEYEKIVKLGYKVLSNGVESMDIWDKGVRFFIISGPDRERIEFCQRLA